MLLSCMKIANCIMRVESWNTFHKDDNLRYLIGTVDSDLLGNVNCVLFFYRVKP